MILAKGGGSYLHIQGYFRGGLANPGGQVIVVAFNFLWRGGGVRSLIPIGGAPSPSRPQDHTFLRNAAALLGMVTIWP